MDDCYRPSVLNFDLGKKKKSTTARKSKCHGENPIWNTEKIAIPRACFSISIFELYVREATTAQVCAAASSSCYHNNKRQ